MLVFDTPQNAADFACAVQTGMTTYPLALRIGMAVGDPVEENNDVYGAVVNLASRVAAEAAPGAVALSDGTKQLLVGKP
jgi:adenylate cyclase